MTEEYAGEEKRFIQRPTVVTMELHNSLWREVRNLKERVTGAEMVVHEISRSNELVVKQISEWINTVMLSLDSLTKITHQNRIIICVVVMIVFLQCMFIGLQLGR